jgi:5-methylcytosine-specific restriction endonuclease McrA
LVCGKKILAGLNKKTCSRVCSNQNRIGIKYKIGRPKDKAVKFRSLKIRILKERGGKCERCNYSKYEILQVHHKDRNRLNNNLENLELICPNCHYEEHFLEKSWLRKT